MKTRLYLLFIFSLALGLTLTACAANSPRVFFRNIEDGATVSSPVHLEWAAENFTIEAAGEVVEKAGHLHVMVNTPCVSAGEVIPSDETHLHFGKAQLEADLELPAGSHTLCLQAADGLHTALSGEGMTQVIDITVRE